VLLLDASVWVATIDSDDRYHAASRGLVLDATRPLAALDLTLYEVANVVGVMKGRDELGVRLCNAIVERTGERLIRVDAKLAKGAIALAREHDLTAYDAAYMAAAQARKWTLVSADVKDLVKPGLALAPDDERLG
jgi:predicted nucleic acid-binding protein